MPAVPSLMQDVAARAGVSVTTVSHVLNDTRPVARETRERVLRAARDLNYYKNSWARLLARGRSDTLGLIISDIENPFFAELIKTFEIACLEKGMEALLATTNYDPAQARKAVRRMIESKAVGVAVMTSQLDAEFVAEMANAGIPLVLLDGAEIGPGRGAVRVDQRPGAIEAVQHLRRFGHRRFGIIAGLPNRVSAIAYRQALSQAVADAGVAAPLVLETPNTADGGSAAIREWLARGALPTAILCGNDLCAFGAMGAIFEAGLKVPDDVSVVGADDIAFARFSHPPLTTVRIPRDLVGRAAFEALWRMLRNKRGTGREDTIPTLLAVRQSTGPAPKSGR